GHRVIVAFAEAEAQVRLPGVGQHIDLYLHEIACRTDVTGPRLSPGERVAEGGRDGAVVAATDESGHRSAPGGSIVGGELEHTAVEGALKGYAMPEGEDSGGGVGRNREAGRKLQALVGDVVQIGSEGRLQAGVLIASDRAPAAAARDAGGDDRGELAQTALKAFAHGGLADRADGRRRRDGAGSGGRGAGEGGGGSAQTAVGELEVADARAPVEAAGSRVVLLGIPEGAVIDRVDRHV